MSPLPSTKLTKALNHSPQTYSRCYTNAKIAQITLSGKHFTPYITNDLTNPGPTNAPDTDEWVSSNLY